MSAWMVASAAMAMHATHTHQTYAAGTAQAAVRARKYRTLFNGAQMKSVMHLERNVTNICVELHMTVSAALYDGRPYTIPHTIFDTLHAAAHAIESWLHAHIEHFYGHEIESECSTLREIQANSNRVPMILDPSCGEDGSICHIEAWIEITRLFGLCLRVARGLKRRGVAVFAVEPNFVIYPPLILLRRDVYCDGII
jgi:hypothetical protein